MEGNNGLKVNGSANRYPTERHEAQGRTTMTTIRATCPSCGEVELTPEDLELKVCSSNSTSSYYRFCCPLCTEEVRKPADDRIVQLLISGGVQATVWELASEDPHGDAPVFTIDDLLDFHNLLQSDDWYDALLRADA